MLVAGLVVLLIVAGLMFVRRVEPVEVAGTLLFIPIFVGFIFKGLKGGLIMAILASLAYAGLRYPAIDLVGAGRFTTLIASRTLAYLAFGTIGGFANSQLERSLTKLDLFDQVDDVTGLFNARFFVDNTGLEIERGERYQTIFGVVVVDIPAQLMNGLPRRQKERLVKELGATISDSIRTVDRGVHAADATQHRFAAILPETAQEGGRVFAGRLVAKMVEVLKNRVDQIEADQVSYQVVTFPADLDALQQLRREFASLEAIEHPESAHTV